MFCKDARVKFPILYLQIIISLIIKVDKGTVLNFNKITIELNSKRNGSPMEILLQIGF